MFVNAAIRSCLVLVAYLPGPSVAADAPIFGAEKPVPRYSFAELSVKTDADDMVTWQVFPQPVKIVKDGGKCYLSGPPGRRYTILVTVVNFKKEKLDTGQTTVIFEKGEDDVVPPDEEDVDPPDVEGATFLSQVQTAYKKETDPDKAKLKEALRKFYEESSQDLVSKAETREGLFLAMSKLAESHGITGKIPSIQAAVGGWLKKKLPWQGGEGDKPLTAADRKLAKAEFDRVVRTLAKVK